VRRLNDSVEQDHYVLKIADIIGVSKEALLQKLNQTEAAAARPLKKVTPQPAAVDKKELEYTKTQDHLLVLMLLQPKLRQPLDILTPEMFTNENSRQLLAFLQKNRDFDGTPDTAAALKPIGDYVKITLLQYEELYQGLELTELQYEVTRLQARLVEQFVKHKKEQLITQLRSADDALTISLLEHVKALDTLLNSVKGGA